jgi:hypothetical protein
MGVKPIWLALSLVALHALQIKQPRGRCIGLGSGPGRRLAYPLARYQHDNAWRGVPRYYSPDSIERSFWDLVVLFNVAELLAERIGQGPFDVKGLLAISHLPQQDKRLHAVRPKSIPVGKFNAPVYKLLLDGCGERFCAVARRTGDPRRDFHVAGHAITPAGAPHLARTQ